VTIRKGADWGEEAARPAGLVVLADDAAVRRHVERARRAGVTIPPFTVLGGSLATTVGITGRGLDPAGAERWRHLPLDVVRIELDSAPHWFVAHAVFRRSWWFGTVVAAMNTEFLGRWDVAPRGHPNDGRVDVLEADRQLSLRQRWLASRRLPDGSHLPHPAIATRRVRHAEWTFPRPLTVWLDGQRVGRARRVELTVEPDAATLCVGW
jgi:hypothetical protein